MQMKPYVRAAMLAAASINFSVPVFAQALKELPAVVVTGNPLGSDLSDLVSPVSVMDDHDLTLRGASTLGETVGTLPGVSSTWFGPNASRPVIRGLDGDRVRILGNGNGTVDASSLSFDHAVTVDPLVIERVEVVRGPAALMYGGNAIGGVVNALDNRIPQAPQDGVSGRVDGVVGGADSTRALAGRAEIGKNGLTLHADGFTRSTSDLRIPDSTGASRLRNSAADTDGGGIGASFAGDKGYIGASYGVYDSTYGTVAEENVTIDMRSERWDLAGELRDLDGFITGVKFRAGHTDYRHVELDDGEPATRFFSKGTDLRLEASHRQIGAFRGVIGAQYDSSDFSALGDEAFVPSTHTHNRALFVFEETRVGDLKLTFGGRIERVEVGSEGGGPDDANNPGTPRFDPSQERRFTARSAAFGAIYPLNDMFSVASQLAHTERAPTFYELYADGPHAATGNYELGDSTLDKERSNSIDAQLRIRKGEHSGSIGVFHSRFSNYIALAGTGTLRDEDGLVNNATGELPEFLYQGVPAKFYGVEAQAHLLLCHCAGDLHLDLQADMVRASNRDTGEPLPRIAPVRGLAALNWQREAVKLRLEVQGARRQDRVDAESTPTAGYTLVNAFASYAFQSGGVNWEAWLRGNNLFDTEARNAVSFLKDIAPMAGRSVMAGLRASF
ncbi:TonB-dependent receptor [Methyloversatilis thermotolerans]|uniref:TonB-dependent receptor n=1 Tax=Methyloversatilis thermotolerans TaxID=1346290 RepID=UPI0003A54CD3|nr:TonB-dependent receptor [Methyloversatilis thermotolerans]